jgi:hypothetical protein
MKTYTGRRDASGNTHVNVIFPNGRAERLPLRLDLYNHSPDGFEWGYGGSGPAQLALAILADVLGAPARKARSSWWDEAEDDPRTRAVRLHQEFKRKHIAGLDQEQPWTISENVVVAFIQREESGP